jgi:16S rRNA processing protein RimM
MKPEKPILMAVIGAAHGIKGELRVKTFTGEPMALADYGPLYDKDGRRFDIVDLRPAKGVVVVRFKQVADRSAAEALTGTALHVDRSVLAETEEGEFYHADLIGLSVQDETGQTLGSVSAIHDFGGGDIMEVELPGGRTVLVPFTRAAVPRVDIDARVVAIDTVAAGLVDDAEAPPPAATPKPGKGKSAGKGAGKPGFDAGRRPRGPKDAGGNR